MDQIELFGGPLDGELIEIRDPEQPFEAYEGYYHDEYGMVRVKLAVYYPRVDGRFEFLGEKIV